MFNWFYSNYINSPLILNPGSGVATSRGGRLLATPEGPATTG